MRYHLFVECVLVWQCDEPSELEAKFTEVQRLISILKATAKVEIYESRAPFREYGYIEGRMISPDPATTLGLFVHDSLRTDERIG